MARRKDASKTAPRPRARRSRSRGESVVELQGRLTAAFPGPDLAAEAQRVQPVNLDRPEVRESASDAELIATARVYALRVFLARNGHETMAQACDELGLSDQELWDRALLDAGLPPSPLPDHIHIPV
ncbi:MAG: hypothetical protein AAF495_19660 [Pseudomonadota bacterium]